MDTVHSTPGSIPNKLYAKGAPWSMCASTPNAQKSLMHTKNYQAYVHVMYSGEHPVSTLVATNMKSSPSIEKKNIFPTFLDI